MYLSVGNGLLASIGLSHLIIAIFLWGGADGKEIARGLHLVKGMIADVTREVYVVLITENLIGATAGRSYEYQ